MEWDVAEVRTDSHLSLFVRFMDGTHGHVRFEPSHLTGVFSALKEPSLFGQVFIDRGVVSWPGNLDIAPDAMYDALKSDGEWVLR